MVPNIEQDSILFSGYSTLYKEYNVTTFNHKNKDYSLCEAPKPPGVKFDCFSAVAAKSHKLHDGACNGGK